MLKLRVRKLAHCDMLALPRMMAPALRSFWATKASRGTVAPMSSCEPAIRIIKLVRNDALVYKVVRREQTCRAHLVLGSNVVFHQDWDSMKGTSRVVCEHI